MIHLLLHEMNGEIPKWLDEGIASYIGQDNNLSWIEKTVKDLKPPNLDELNTGDDYERFFQRGGYQFSYTIVEFIVSAYGYDKLLRLIHFPEDFEGSIGLSKTDFEKRWHHELKLRT